MNLAMIPKRVVLDTNVCLDLFVFCDPRWNALLAALREGALEAVTREDCRMEWLMVLNYRHLPLDDASRACAAAEFDALIAPVRSEPLNDCPPVRLPLCKDPDDQKFLELARDAGASLLITKDKALLKLAGKIRRAGLFDIMLPEKWLATREATRGEPSQAG
jgi:predicted nucleic acid-binding protein